MRPLYAIVLALSFSATFARGDDPLVPPAPEKPIAVKNYNELHDAYRENPVAAAKKYDDRRVRIYNYESFSEKVEKRNEHFYLVEAVGLRSIAFQAPVYGVEYELNQEGEDQYATIKKEERSKWQLVGTVKGTRNYPENIFGGTMLQIVDCSFVKKSDEDLKKEAERSAKARNTSATKKKSSSHQKQMEAKKAAELARRQAEYLAALEDTKAKRIYRTALSLLDRGFPKEAKKQLQSILDKYPDTPTAKIARQKIAMMEE